MLLGGLQKLSLIDYPGELSAVVFTKGCNFECGYCYNRELVKIDKSSLREDQEDLLSLSKEDFFDFLKKRKDKLDAVVISGGEPTIHNDLEEFIYRIRKMGYKIKLDTNGTAPEVVASLLNGGLLDHIAMDIKASPDNYSLVAGVRVDLKNILKSIKIITKGGIPYEFRTTLAPVFFNKNELEGTGEMIRGARNWYLQKFILADDIIDERVKEKGSFTDTQMEEFRKIGEKYVDNCFFR